MRKWVRIGGAALMVAFVVTAAGANNRRDEKPLTDAEFVKKAAGGGLAEVEMGKLAVDRAADPDVKKFGERMVTDHTKANEQLAEIAKELRIPVPDRPGPEEQKHIDMLREHKGADFDRVYMMHMVKDHEEDVALFTRAAKECKNEKLKEFAEKTLPTLKDHLEMAKKINGRLEKK